MCGDCGRNPVTIANWYCHECGVHCEFDEGRTIVFEALGSTGNGDEGGWSVDLETFSRVTGRMPEDRDTCRVNGGAYMLMNHYVYLPNRENGPVRVTVEDNDFEYSVKVEPILKKVDPLEMKKLISFWIRGEKPGPLE